MTTRFVFICLMSLCAAMLWSDGKVTGSIKFTDTKVEYDLKASDGDIKGTAVIDNSIIALGKAARDYSITAPGGVTMKGKIIFSVGVPSVSYRHTVDVTIGKNAVKGAFESQFLYKRLAVQCPDGTLNMYGVIDYNEQPGFGKVKGRQFILDDPLKLIKKGGKTVITGQKGMDSFGAYIVDMKIGAGTIKGNVEKDMFAENYKFNLDTVGLKTEDILLFLLLNDITYIGNKLLDASENE